MKPKTDERKYDKRIKPTYSIHTYSYSVPFSSILFVSANLHFIGLLDCYESEANSSIYADVLVDFSIIKK